MNPKEKVSKYFTMVELTQSAKAKARKLDNTPNEAQAAKLKELAVKVLDPVRDFLGRPLGLSNAFRSAAVNLAVGSKASDSAHLHGCAADMLIAEADYDKVRKFLQTLPEVDFAQCYVGRNFIHVNIARPGQQPRRLFLKEVAPGRQIPWQSA